MPISTGKAIIGAAALLTSGSVISNTLRDPILPAMGGGRDPENFQRIKEAGGISGTWGRLKMAASQGVIKGTAESGVLGGLAGGVSESFKYAGNRTMDTLKGAQLPGVATAGAIGTGVGALIGGILGTKIKGGLGRGAGMGALLGGLSGGIGMAKVDMAVARTVIEARKNVLSKGRAGRLSNRVKSGGPGYRLWASRSRGAIPMGKPGHLGMDGSLPFSMHKARHRSTV